MEKNINWWKNAIVYQIYPLSFKDSNHDGIGDIKGIKEKLPYLKNYGVDVIWLSPVYESPMDDNGYDISNYKEVNPMFGTNQDLDDLIDEVHKHGMKIIMDLVVNHTSDMHPWFLDSKQSKTSKYRDYYIWQDKPEPDIRSIFSGPAWTYDETTKSYYFHLFSKRQPDLNWNNEDLRKEIYDMINFWLDKGIDGFRMDVIELIGKEVSQGKIADGPYLEKHLNEMYEACFKGRDIMNVGEMNGISIQRAKEITNDKNLGLHMTFQFSHMGVDELPGKGKWALKKYEPKDLKSILIQNNHTFEDGGWNALFLSNHDQVRQITRFGSELDPIKSGQMLFTMLYLQRGTPYVYMGEEIGMTGFKSDSIEAYKDIETINYYNEAKSLGIEVSEIMKSIYKKGRDNSRTPFQWNDADYAGFSTVKPWLDVHPNYKNINLKNELENPDGIYHFTKKLFEIRKKYDVFYKGSFEVIDESSDATFIYLRKYQNTQILVITNMTDKPTTVDLSQYQSFKVLLENDVTILSKETLLKPFHAAVFIKEN